MFENLSAGRKILAVFSVFAILVFASGGLILWSADGVARDGIRVGEGLAPLGDAVMEVKLTGTFAHMRLEEIISGEVVGNFDSISEQLEAARLFAHAILDGADLPKAGISQRIRRRCGKAWTQHSLRSTRWKRQRATAWNSSLQMTAWAVLRTRRSMNFTAASRMA